MRKPLSLYALLIAVIAVVSLLLTQGTALAVVTCSPAMNQTTDTDKDGFTDYQECYGFSLPNGDPVYGKYNSVTDYTNLHNCGQNEICLDPDNRDLFVILVYGSPTNIPSNPLEYVTNSTTIKGLGLRAHIVTQNQIDSSGSLKRGVVSSPILQNAVRVTEDLTNDSSLVLGASSVGTPNGQDNATVFTQRIKNSIISITGGADPTLVNNYIKHTIAHEIGHMVGPLAPVYNSNYGGNHYKTGTGTIMDQFVSSKGTSINIGTGYSSTDQGKINLLK
jgi:hypothetical protein